MKRFTLPMRCIMVFALAGCAGAAGTKSADAPVAADPKPAPERVLGLPDGWEMMPAGAGVNFTASQTPGEVIIRVNGNLPAANYEAKLFPSPLRIWPPQYLLARRKTGDVGAQVITPFEVMAVFKAKELVQEVVVSDAGGAHRTKVDQARD